MEAHNALQLVISHRSLYHEQARALAEKLGSYGIEAFLAQDEIAAGSNYRNALIDALKRMDALLVFLTDDFAESAWCNQEVGFAVAREVPILPLKLQSQNPTGIIEPHQALSGSLGDAGNSAAAIRQALSSLPELGDRFRDALITSFLESTSFVAAIERFDALDAAIAALSPANTRRIIVGFQTNDQLYGAGYFENRFLPFLHRKTGQRFYARNGQITTSRE